MTHFMTTGGLKGLRVLDLGHALAAPFCSQMLADHGADVIKIEPPDGDMSRRIGPFTDDDNTREYGGMFQSCNRNKRGMVIDFKNAEGREVFLKMVDNADVLIENFRSGVMERLGLSYEVLSKRNPRLVYTSIRGFGDPRGGKTAYTDWPAVDIVAQAMGGLMSITGPDAGSPMRVGGGPGDTIPGLFAAYATLVAVLESRISGKGQYVDVSMIDSMVALFEPLTVTYTYTGVPARPGGSRMPGIAPFGRVATKDGFAVIAVSAGRGWELCCEIIGRTDLIADPRFSTHAARGANPDEVYAAIEEFTRQHTCAELLALFGGKIPFAPVYDSVDIFNDPYFKVREMLPQVEQPGSKRKVTVAGVPQKLSRTPGGVYQRAPTLGEHTDDILGEIGLSAEEIALLHQSGAIA
ncbi:Succinyl-CoA:mesaconate CoA-transferase [Georgfuchsia toluolica]|uniref:Succinyl-CoA:mesaconate CoA-transferase n=1 Tax=Georgfuchsia toluolica TaxID=424218 RepID=A0A916J1A1_9PROT|nr:CoA transferase [Georgfuchsia toluolica]CAG4882280.1 Succinyl-CoA:mesaconate CoA-transferase [Georgfuchsia toluolica]